jgi:hypothetical protein
MICDPEMKLAIRPSPHRSSAAKAEVPAFGIADRPAARPAGQLYKRAACPGCGLGQQLDLLWPGIAQHGLPGPVYWALPCVRSARPAIVSRRPAARHRCSGLTEQRSAAGIVVPTAAADCPVSGQRGATCHRGIDAVNGWFAAQPPRARLAASASSAALSFLKTASMASGSRLASSSSPASTSSS